MGFSSVHMPQNYIAMNEMGTNKEDDGIVNAATPVIKRICRKIEVVKPLERAVPENTLVSTALNPILYFNMKTSKFHASDACIQCQKCVAVCPLNNVRIENKMPH